LALGLEALRWLQEARQSTTQTAAAARAVRLAEQTVGAKDSHPLHLRDVL
jgi:hypothetical protein